MDVEIRHGAKIGRFVVVGELGAGGMGVVYAAHDPELDRKVALKVLRAAAATDEERLRLLREGQAMARVTHPNVITVYEVGTQDTLVFLAQELLDGGTLGEWLEAPRARDELVGKFIAAGHGLAAAHAAGLVHRDFKPDNVLLGKDGRVRVADFGLARALGPIGDGLTDENRANVARAQLDLSRSPMLQLTRTGAVMGTPMFMAPEQHNGLPADARSDQFAFSVALYQALYGAWPFAGKTAVALADAVIDGRMERPPSGRDVPARLHAILMRGLRTSPAERYPTMQALLADLERKPTRRMRTAVLAIAALALVGGAIVGGYALRTRDDRASSTFDSTTLASHRGVEWLTTAIDRGQLDNAIEKYDMAGSLAHQSGEAVHASIARASNAIVLALRGRMELARAHLADALASAGSDAIARAYAELATATVALASGDLAHAHCATTGVPELAAMCLEIRGDVAAARGDVSAARTAYRAGLALHAFDPLSFELDLAALELDTGNVDGAVAKATELQATAAEQGAISCEERAWILLARAHLAQAASSKALEDLQHVKLGALEAIAVRLEARATLGETTALLGDPVAGFADLDAARSEAEQQGLAPLALATRLARLDAMFATAAPDAVAAQRQLVADAKARGYDRIAHLAEIATQR